MTAAIEVRDLLTRFRLRPRKSLGQNFLIDDAALDRIVSAAEITSGDWVLEIGPGLGTLTRRLAQNAGRVVAVEIDRNLIPALRFALAAHANVTLIHGDILQIDPASLFSGPPSYKVVANLPYYVTSAVIRHLLEATPRPSRLILTMQLEVAQRLIAAPGDLSLLAVSVQFYGKPSIVARVKAGSFYPMPQVDSAVVRIDAHDRPPVDVRDVEQFFAVAKAGFGQKRKQLHNALKAGLPLSPETIGAALGRAHIDPRRRAETLSLQEWAILANALRSETAS